MARGRRPLCHAHGCHQVTKMTEGRPGAALRAISCLDDCDILQPVFPLPPTYLPNKDLIMSPHRPRFAVGGGAPPAWRSKDCPPNMAPRPLRPDSPCAVSTAGPTPQPLGGSLRRLHDLRTAWTGPDSKEFPTIRKTSRSGDSDALKCRVSQI